jgi:hypothetical protein
MTMNKKYIVKLTPIDFELVGLGDYLEDTAGNIRPVDEFDLHTEAFLTRSLPSQRFFRPNLTGPDGVIHTYISPYGRILKDGDKIDEGDIKHIDACINYRNRHLWKDCSCKMGFVDAIHIKK